MHELAIAESIISSVIQEKEARKLGAVSAVGVRIGTLSGVFPEALAFSFQAAVPETPLQGVSLEIEKVQARARCRDCRAEFEVEGPFFICSACESVRVEVMEGFELEIAYIEAEEESPDSRSA